jgi:hypothetical protein
MTPVASNDHHKPDAQLQVLDVPPHEWVTVLTYGNRGFSGEDASRGKPDLLNGIKVICPVQPLRGKYSCWRLTQISLMSHSILSHSEGRWPSSRTLGWDAVDAAALGAWSCSQGGLCSVSEHSVQTNGEAAYGKTVWFWHPLLVSSRRRRVGPTGLRQSISADDGDKNEFVAGEITA